MASTTKESLGAALKQMLTVKPIDKITVKDLVEICGVNRQTFYYHFDDVYDLLEWVFEEDANRVLPSEVVYEHWRDDVMMFFKYLADNSVFALNIYNSNSRIYMLRYFKRRLQGCIRSFAIIVSEGKNIDRTDFESASSTNSNTPARCSKYISFGRKIQVKILHSAHFGSSAAAKQKPP